MSFIVIYDDEGGLCAPMAWDDACEGALTGQCGKAPVATFSTRVAARQAIKVSACYARLQEAQGKPFNTDFTTYRKCLKVLPLAPARPAVK